MKLIVGLLMIGLVVVIVGTAFKMNTAGNNQSSTTKASELTEKIEGINATAHYLPNGRMEAWQEWNDTMRPKEWDKPLMLAAQISRGYGPAWGKGSYSLQMNFNSCANNACPEGQSFAMKSKDFSLNSIGVVPQKKMFIAYDIVANEQYVFSGDVSLYECNKTECAAICVITMPENTGQTWQNRLGKCKQVPKGGSYTYQSVVSAGRSLVFGDDGKPFTVNVDNIRILQ